MNEWSLGFSKRKKRNPGVDGSPSHYIRMSGKIILNTTPSTGKLRITYVKRLNELELAIENKQKELLLNEVTIEKESYKLGVSSSLDVYESEINLNNQSLKLIELNNNIYKSYFSLLNQLGDLKVNQ